MSSFPPRTAVRTQAVRLFLLGFDGGPWSCRPCPPFVAVCNHEVAGWRTAKCFQSTTRFSKVRRPTPVASPPQQERVSEKTYPTTLIFSHELPVLFILRYRLEIQGRPLGMQRLRGTIHFDRLPSLLLPERHLEGEGLEMGMLRVRSPIRTNHR